MEFDPSTPANQEGMAHVKALLRHIGEDPEREGLLETPKRVIKAMTEHFAGYHEDPASHLEKTFEEVEGYDELVMVSDIELHSHCEHHMVPFVGLAHVAYIPNGPASTGKADLPNRQHDSERTQSARRCGDHPMPAFLHVLSWCSQVWGVDHHQ